MNMSFPNSKTGATTVTSAMADMAEVATSAASNAAATAAAGVERTARALSQRWQMKRTLALAWVGVLYGFVELYDSAQQFSGFAAGPLAAMTAVTLHYVVLRYGHRKLDVITELKSGNIAVALYVLAIAFLICIPISVALLATVL